MNPYNQMLRSILFGDSDISRAEVVELTNQGTFVQVGKRLMDAAFADLDETPSIAGDTLLGAQTMRLL